MVRHITTGLLSLAILSLNPGCVAASASNAPPVMQPHLVAPAHGKIPIAFVVSDMANVIDLAETWEVFQDTQVPSRGASDEDQYPFQLFIVADKRAPAHMTGGMQLIPNYTFDDAPPAAIIVVGAQSGLPNPKLAQFLRARHAKGEAIASVCTGAFELGAAGLLDGKRATTHHEFLALFHKKYPKVTLVPGSRYVESDPTIFTAGGLTSGIDLALHIVSLYFGSDIAARTAKYMEYTGTGWRSPNGTNPSSE